MKKEFRPYDDLFSEMEGENIFYSDLLMTTEWNSKREEILKRDEYYCQNCGFSETLWHKGDLISFDKSKKIDTIHNGERIVADHPFKSDRPIYLHVHHKYYIVNKLPWEYDNESLETLCNWCHWDFHEENTVPIYIEKNGELFEMNYTPCFRCNGAGVFPEYKHIQNGVCFRCKGRKFEELISNSVDEKKDMDDFEDGLSF